MKNRMMMNRRMMHLSQSIFCLFSLLGPCGSLIINPAIGILSETSLYLAQIKELNYNADAFYRVYHHHDPVYHLQSFAANYYYRRLYFCSPTTIYTLDLRQGSSAVPILPVDETPCRASLTYLPTDATLLWSYRRALVQWDFNDFSKRFLFNSSSSIFDFISNGTSDSDELTFYVSVAYGDHDSAILQCQSDRTRTRLYPFENCLYIDSDFDEAVALAMNGNLLYVADRRIRRIFVLTLLPSGYVVKKDVLPLNSSTVADIQSMSIYDNHLVWLTNSGHVRIVSLIDYQYRTIFWFDEPLISVRLVSFAQWPNQTSTTSRSTSSSSSTVTSTTTTTTTKAPSTSSRTTQLTSTDGRESSTISMNNNPWKATAYVTSIILGLALFLCAAMIACVLLNYRLGRVVPNSFTNILHILRNRTSATTPTQNNPLTLSMDLS